MQWAEPIPKQVGNTPERPVPTGEPTGVEPMEVEEEPQRVQQAIPAEIEDNPPEVTSVYRQSRSSSLLPQFEGGPSSSGESQREVGSTSELPEFCPLPLVIRLP